MIDVYESAVDESGRYGGVFERDDDTACFYLLDLTRDAASQVVEAFNAQSVTEMAPDAATAVRWSATGDAVGLFVNGELRALFDPAGEGRQGRWATKADQGLFPIH